MQITTRQSLERLRSVARISDPARRHRAHARCRAGAPRGRSRCRARLCRRQQAGSDFLPLHLLRRLRYLGRKRAHGHGRILGVEVERIEEDRSLIWQGRAMRWLPDPSGARLVRPRPPYWHPFGRVRCLEGGPGAEIYPSNAFANRLKAREGSLVIPT